MKTKQSANDFNRENYTARIVAVSLLAILLLPALTGCKNKTVVTGPDPVGVYTLVSVDGKTLPCTLTHAGTTMNIQSGSFTITAEGKCTSSINLSMGSNQNLTKITQATFTQSGAELTMNWERAGTTRGSVADDTFTMNNEGMIFAYRK